MVTVAFYVARERAPMVSCPSTTGKPRSRYVGPYLRRIPSYVRNLSPGRTHYLNQLWSLTGPEGSVVFTVRAVGTEFGRLAVHVA